MSEPQITGVVVRPVTEAEAVSALSSGQAKRFILLTEETVPNEQGGESVTVLCDRKFPRELVFELIEKILQRPAGTLEDNGLSNN